MRKNAKWVFAAGCMLIAASLCLLLVSQVKSSRGEKLNAEIVRTMESILGEGKEGALDPDRAAEMPALELRGENYIALLEIPAYGVKLPVSGAWDKGRLAYNPCRFSGSAYDGSLVIGGVDSRGQFDFFDRISDGATVKLSDMSGACFTYAVERIERSDSASAEKLADGEGQLTLFVRNARGMEYIILRCVMK